MHITLDDVSAILAQDELRVLEATSNLGKQCAYTWDDVKGFDLPDSYRDVDHIIVSAMGGSHLGAQIIRTALADRMKVPLLVRSTYTPDYFVGPRSLVLATSFSGNTEEPLAFAKSAIERGAKVACICSGGDMETLARTHNLPCYSFTTELNPSRVPRYGSGYLFMAQVAVLANLGLIEVDEEEVAAIVSRLEATAKQYSVEMPEGENAAKQLARAFDGKGVVLVPAEHLVGSTHVFKNQLNESAKQFSAMFVIPELNHHLLEGLAHPEANTSYLHFCFVESALYHPRIQHRYSITRAIVSEQGIATSAYAPVSDTKIVQAFEAVSFMSHVALYLGILTQENPGTNPWVDELKRQLASYS